MSWVHRDGRFVDLADPDGSARGVVDINDGSAARHRGKGGGHPVEPAYR
ncbi:hypothetical protein ACN27G_35150 [Plantactinospora sp. WMMB334]